VHTNPFTGREVLFLSNPNHQIVEDYAPSNLGDLIEYGYKTALYTHKWENGDLLLWDNV